MAILGILGFEQASTGGDPAVAASGTLGIQSATKRSGTYSLQINPTGSNNAWISYDMASADNGYVKFYFRFAAVPAASQPFFSFYNPGGSPKAHLRIGSDGKVSLWDSSNAVVGTGAMVLSANEWYRIDFNINSSGTYALSIDGTSQLSGTGSFINGSNHSTLRLGRVTVPNSENIDFYYDDVMWGNSSLPSGDLAVVPFAPTSVGTSAAWNTGTNASNHLEVDEIPPDEDTTYIAVTNSGGTPASYFFIDPVGTFNGSIHAVQAYGRLRATSGTPNVNVAIKNGGSVQNGGNVLSSSYQWLSLTRTTNPNGNAAWTSAALSTTEVGVSTGQNGTIRATSLLMTVAVQEYIPPAEGASAARKAAFTAFFN